MSEIKGMRLWQWAVWLLVACNVALLATIWLKPCRQGPPPLPHESPREYVIRNLRFSDDQVKKYDVLIRGHQQAMRDLRDQANNYRQALFSGLTHEYSSNSTTDSLTKLIANTQKEIEIVTYNHFVQVRALCTEDQKKNFDTLIGSVIKKMNSGPPHPPPGGPRGGPGQDGPPPPPQDERPNP